MSFIGRTEAVAKSIGNSFGGFLDWDKWEANRFGSYFRIRAWVKVEAPLRHGQLIAPTSGDPAKVKFKYEKLINFCYRCARMNHVQRDCEVEVSEAPPLFGPWLRADGDRFFAPHWRAGGGRIREHKPNGDPDT